MSIVNRLARLAQSPQGRKIAERATHAAKDPKTRRQIGRVRESLINRRKPR
jgi:hypothetical protein